MKVFNWTHLSNEIINENFERYTKDKELTEPLHILKMDERFIKLVEKYNRQESRLSERLKIAIAREEGKIQIPVKKCRLCGIEIFSGKYCSDECKFTNRAILAKKNYYKNTEKRRKKYKQDHNKMKNIMETINKNIMPSTQEIEPRREQDNNIFIRRNNGEEFSSISTSLGLSNRECRLGFARAKFRRKNIDKQLVEVVE